MSCPKTEQEFQNYFFNLIGRSLDAPADDWAFVMTRQYPWNGQMLTIPPGVGPGVILPSDAPFYGLTQQWSDGPKARLFLPTAEADANGYFTRNIQYIRRVNPDGINPTHVWSWFHKDGHEYVPICDGGGSTPVPPNPDFEARLRALEVRYALLEERVTELEKNQVTLPKKIALRSIANGKIVAAEINSTMLLIANRDGIGPWEKFELVVVE